MADEKIQVRVTATGQTLDVVVFNKRLDSITVVIGEGVHNVRVDLTPTRNGMPSIANGATGMMRTANTAASPRSRSTLVISSIFDPASWRTVFSGSSRPA